MLNVQQQLILLIKSISNVETCAMDVLNIIKLLHSLSHQHRTLGQLMYTAHIKSYRITKQVTLNFSVIMAHNLSHTIKSQILQELESLISK